MVCHYDLIVPFRAGCGTLLLQVAGRSKGQFPHASLYEYVGHLYTKNNCSCQGKSPRSYRSPVGGDAGKKVKINGLSPFN